MNYFAKNRKEVQKAILESEFVKPLTITDLPLEIVESKAEKGKLRKLILENIPASDEIRPKSWLIDLELEKTLFSKPQHFKTAEKAIVFFTCESLYILLFEMKNSLKPFDDSGLDAIKTKFIDSIGRMSVLITSYLFDNEDYKNIEIKYFGLIFYNEEFLNQQASTDKDFDRNDLYKIFKKGNDEILLNNTHLQTTHKVNIHFIQNPDKQNSIEEITFDLNEFFKDDVEYENGQFTQLTCPL